MSGSAGWAIGVSLNLIGSIVLNVGTNFMKFGFIIRKQLELRQESSDAAAPLVGNKARTPRIWYVGVVLMVVGGVTVFGSLGFAPQSLLAPLGSIQFVSNVFLGRFLLKERVTSRTIFATCLLMLGSALSVVFGDHEHQEYTLRDLKALYTVGYVVFLIVLLSIAATLHYTFKRYHEYAVKGGPIPPPYHKYVYPLSYCNTSAIIGTQGAIFAKAASHIVSESARGNNQLQYPLSWVFIIGAICGSIFWLVRMNSALKMFDGLFIIPALQVCWIFWMILVGGTYYQEFESLQAWQICGFIISIGIIFTGVYLLVPSDSEEEMRRHSFHDPKLDERQLDTLEKAMGGGDMLQEVEMSSNIHTLREKTESVQNLENLDKERMDAITRYTNIVFNEVRIRASRSFDESPTKIQPSPEKERRDERKDPGSDTDTQPASLA
mmetsp:Transcript_21208/g.64599  ORF Transcript_21208/g.64599 Transcript_21208/m.64599 type:complete len:436 (-) Transcript_21208:429-1736(-)